MSDFKRDELEQRKLADFKPIARTAVPEEELEEEYEEEEASSFGKFRFLMPIIVLAIVCFVSYAWYTDKFAISRDSTVDLPIVKASLDPLREKPEDPGGMKIINRDKRVYDAISGKDNDKDKKPESLLPAPEEPLRHDEVAKITGDTKPAAAPELINKLPDDSATTAATIAATNTQPEKVEPSAGKPAELENITIANREEPVSKAESTATPKAVEPAKPIVVASARPPVETVAPAPAKTEIKETVKVAKAVTADDIKDVAPKKEAAVETIKKAPSTHSGYRVQLGSFRSEGDAEITWKSIKKKHAAIIGDLGNYIEKADLGEKGIYYRLQISGFKAEADARKTCDALKEKKQECLFVGK